MRLAAFRTIKFSFRCDLKTWHWADSHGAGPRTEGFQECCYFCRYNARETMILKDRPGKFTAHHALPFKDDFEQTWNFFQQDRHWIIISSPETACPAGQFGRECERQCNCANQTDSCFVHSGGCPSGCAPGYTGEDCYTRKYCWLSTWHSG